VRCNYVPIPEICLYIYSVRSAEKFLTVYYWGGNIKGDMRNRVDDVIWIYLAQDGDR